MRLSCDLCLGIGKFFARKLLDPSAIGALKKSVHPWFFRHGTEKEQTSLRMTVDDMEPIKQREDAVYGHGTDRRSLPHDPLMDVVGRRWHFQLLQCTDDHPTRLRVTKSLFFQKRCKQSLIHAIGR